MKCVECEQFENTEIAKEDGRMKTFDIYFGDLNEDAQKRLMDKIGIDDPKEMNWDMDICPLVIFEFEEEE